MSVLHGEGRVLSNLLEVLGVTELVQWIKSSAFMLAFTQTYLDRVMADVLFEYLKTEGTLLFYDGRLPLRHKKFYDDAWEVSFRASGNLVQVFWFRGNLIIIKGASVSSHGRVGEVEFHLYTPRSFLDIQDLLVEASEHDSVQRNEVVLLGNVHKIGGQGDRVEDTILYSDPEDRTLVCATYPEPYQKEVLQELYRWWSLSTWYWERLIPHTRGYLFYGKPGTGKSSFVRSLTAWFGFRVDVLDLSSMTNASFSSYWSGIEDASFCRVVLIEDIDAVFEGRENVTPGDGPHLTWDCFINALSGVIKRSHSALIITTNRPEVLDPSLATVVDGRVVGRPGRIDKVVEFLPLSAKGREWLVNVILDLYGDDTKALVDRGEGMTGAQFNELCVQEALKGVWGSK